MAALICFKIDCFNIVVAEATVFQLVNTYSITYRLTVKYFLKSRRTRIPRNIFYLSSLT